MYLIRLQIRNHVATTAKPRALITIITNLCAEIVSPNLQMRKPRLREIKKFAQAHARVEEPELGP